MDMVRLLMAKQPPKERENETRRWFGSNFYYYSLAKYPIRLYNNPFNYTGVEINYLSNPDAKILLDYNSSDLRYKIAAYELNYGSGKVISTGIPVIFKDPGFISFFDDLLVNHALPSNFAKKLNVPTYASPPIKPAVVIDSDITNENRLRFKSILGGGDGKENADTSISIGTITNRSDGKQIFGIVGKTLNWTAKIATQELDYKGKNIFFAVGDVAKYGNTTEYKEHDNIVSFTFDIKGKQANHKLIFFHPDYYKKGWDGNAFIEKIDTGSSRLINLEDLVRMRNDTYEGVNRMTIQVLPFTVLNPFEFYTNLNSTKDVTNDDIREKQSEPITPPLRFPLDLRLTLVIAAITMFFIFYRKKIEKVFHLR